jgi:hypothetical protein
LERAQRPGWRPPACRDGADNDGDGVADLNDPSCQGNPDKDDETNPRMQCQDGVDNDGDGAADFGSDFSCSSLIDNDETNPRAQCQDGADNDGDGLVDLQDPGCSSTQDNNEGDGTSQCQDGLDNDGDGARDFPADASCSAPTDNDETNPKTACQDGIDNDGDSLIDLADPGCKGNPQGGSEVNAEPTTQPRCADGKDNDGDGAIDLDDFSCNGDFNKNDESSPKAQCDDGIDNDGDGKTDLADPDCSSKQDNNEQGGAPSCIDQVTVGITAELDQVALQLSTLAFEAADRLRKDVTAALGSASSVQRDVRRTKALADSQLAEARSLTLKLPNISRTCQGLPSICREVDNAATIVALRGNYARSANVVARTLNRSGFRSQKMTRRYQVLIRQARATARAGNAALDQLPPRAVSCT